MGVNDPDMTKRTIGNWLGRKLEELMKKWLLIGFLELRMSLVIAWISFLEVIHYFGETLKGSNFYELKR